MSEQFENIDQLFNGELENYSPEVPAGAWGNISAGLATRNKRRRVFPLFYKVAASIAFLLATGTIAIYFSSNQDMATETLANHTLSNPISTNDKSETTLASSNNTTNSTIVNKRDIINAELNSNSKTNSTESKTQNKIAPVKENSVPSQQNNLIVASVDNNQTNISPSTYIINENSSNDELFLIPAHSINGKIAYNAPVEELSFKENVLKEYLIIEEEEEPLYAELTYEDENISSRSKWMVGGQAGPQYTHREISSEYTTSELLAKYNSKEDGIMAFAGGVNVEFSPVRRLSIQSGIQYSKMGQQKPAELQAPNQSVPHSQRWNPNYTENETVSYSASSSTGEIVFDNVQSAAPPAANVSESNELNVSKGYADGYNSYNVPQNDEISLSQYFEYIEVPLIARYSVIDRKFGVHLLGGISTNFLVGNSIYLDNQPDAPAGYTEGVAPVNYSSTVGFGLAYTMSDKIKFSIEPQLKYYLSSQIENSKIDVRPYTFGVMTGIKYLF